MTHGTIQQRPGSFPEQSVGWGDSTVRDQIQAPLNTQETKRIPSQRRGGVSVTSRPIKVCFISPLGHGLYQPDSGSAFGGAEVQFFLLSRELAMDQAFHVSVLTTVGERPGAEQHGRLTVVKRQARGRLSVKPYPEGPGTFGVWRGYAAAFWDMWKVLRDIGADCYLHAGAGVEVGAYALICRLLRRRFIYVVASSVDLTHPNGKVKGPLRWLYPMGLRLSDAVVCRSYEQQASLRARYGLEGVLIRTGHQLPTPYPGTRKREEQSAILWVGRIHPVKQPEMFLDLAERFPNEHCVIIAMPDSSHEDLWRHVQRRAAMLPNVTLYERIPWESINSHFKQAKLFLNTSRHEGFPNTFVQAAVHGIPILSWTVDPDGVLSREGIGMCAEGSFERLATSVRQGCASPSQLAEMGRRAEAYARREHDLNRSTEKLKHLVRSLTTGRIW